MGHVFEIEVLSDDLIFVRGEDGLSGRHVFLCDDFEAVTRLIKRWSRDGFEFIGDEAFAGFISLYEEMEREEGEDKNIFEEGTG